MDLTYLASDVKPVQSLLKTSEVDPEVQFRIPRSPMYQAVIDELMTVADVITTAVDLAICLELAESNKVVITKTGGIVVFQMERPSNSRHRMVNIMLPPETYTVTRSASAATVAAH